MLCHSEQFSLMVDERNVIEIEVIRSKDRLLSNERFARIRQLQEHIVQNIL